MTAESRACLELYRRPDKNFFSFVKSRRGLDLESLVGVARRLTSPTSETALQFQMYVVKHYHAVDKHVEILSLDVFSDNMFELF